MLFYIFVFNSIPFYSSDSSHSQQIANTLTQLLQEEIVSPEQYEKLMKDDAALELTTIASIIKDTKIV